MCAHSEHPSVFYDDAERYQANQIVLSERRYFEILSALQKIEAELDPPGLGTWAHPHKLDSDVVSIQTCAREIARRLVFVHNVTILCLDDHHEQGRNKNSPHDIGMACINNPDKCVGIVKHILASHATGMITGRDGQRLRAPVVDSSQRLFSALNSHDADSGSVLGGSNMVDVDHAYSNSSMEMITKNGRRVTSTIKRMTSNPAWDKKATFSTAARQLKLESRGIKRTW